MRGGGGGEEERRRRRRRAIGRRSEAVKNSTAVNTTVVQLISTAQTPLLNWRSRGLAGSAIGEWRVAAAAQAREYTIAQYSGRASQSAVVLTLADFALIAFFSPHQRLSLVTY